MFIIVATALLLLLLLTSDILVFEKDLVLVFI